MRDLIKSTLIALAICLTGCNGEKPCTLTAYMPEGYNDGDSLYVIDYDELKLNDSVAYIARTVIEDGKAVFELSLSQDRMAYVVDQEYIIGSVVLEAGEIALQKGKASGTPLNDQSIAMKQELEQRYGEYEARVEAIRAQAADDVMETRSLINEEYVSLLRDCKAINMRYVVANKDNILGRWVFALYIADDDTILPDDYQSYLAQAGEYISQYPLVKRANARLEARLRTAAGEQYADFGITDTTGCEHRLSDFAGGGKRTLAVLWKDGSRSEIETLYNFLDDHGYRLSQDTELNLMLVNLDDDQRLAAIMGRNYAGVGNYYGSPEIAEAYALRSNPTFVLIDSEGIIRLKTDDAQPVVIELFNPKPVDSKED